MSIIGGAALTPIMGKIADQSNAVAPAYIVPAVCFVGIAMYAWLGSRQRAEELA
jgi:FHS family L-fucose permease-like MFS transporter